ncbi:MAG: hypothetical protein AABW54_00220 [Candidatus Micrarchaeota archaeon]
MKRAVIKLDETYEKLVEAVTEREGISAVEKAHIVTMLKAVRAEVDRAAKLANYSHEKSHAVFRNKLVERASASSRLQRAWLSFQRLVSGKATQAAIDAAISESFADRSQMERAVSSLHASIALNHLDKMHPWIREVTPRREAARARPSGRRVSVR